MDSPAAEYVSNAQWMARIVLQHRARIRREELVDIGYSTIIGLCLGGLLVVLLSGAGR